MTKTLSTFLALFLFTPILLFSKPSGHWRQVFPEENGKIPRPRYNHYMCPIGDQQVLMLAGEGDGNPYYYNETWLYNYKTNIWTEILCDSMPDVYSWTSEPGNHLYKISKTRAIASCLNTPWIFDLDSMKWFAMPEEGGIYNATYIRENVIFSYYVGTKWDDKYPFEAKYAGSSVLCTMHPEEPFDSPDFLTFETVNDEWVTGQGPVTSDPGMRHQQKIFALNNYSQNVTCIPEPSIWDDPKPKFMDIEINAWDWFFLEQSKDTLPNAWDVAFASLTNNLTLIYTGNIIRNGDSSRWNDTITYLVEYVPESKSINVHYLRLSPNPGNIREGHRIIQIKDGIIMLFGGERYSEANGWHLSNETWIFELDSTDVVDNTGNSVKIYVLDNNLYMLDDELKNAILYNTLGQKVLECKDKRLDLNSLPIGIYLLQYTENGSTKTAKIIKK